VPPVPAAAVAVLLVLVLGIGLLGSLGHRGGAGSSTSNLSQRGPAGANYNSAAGAFGRLPVPAATSELPKAASPSEAPTAPSGTYIGAVNLVWAGQLAVNLANAPVYRYFEPSPAAADQFASSLGASRQPGASGVLGSYAGNAFVLSVTGTGGSPVREPSYAITPDRSTLPSPGPTDVDTANSFLSAHSLVPVWPYTVTTANAADVVRVLYLRQFDLPGGGRAYAVDGLGEHYGIEVDLRDGQPLQAFGPLPLHLDVAVYPIISADQAVRAALATSPTRTASSIPTVRLTTAELVYALVWAGDHSFYEPAYLFSGTFGYNGTTYVKRVLVPAVDPSQLSS
jgi:hypothetical protein